MCLCPFLLNLLQHGLQRALAVLRKTLAGL